LRPFAFFYIIAITYKKRKYWSEPTIEMGLPWDHPRKLTKLKMRTWEM